MCRGQERKLVVVVMALGGEGVVLSIAARYHPPQPG